MTPRPTTCADCLTPTQPADAPHEWYMVHDHVWADAGMDSGFLCVGCLERRLDRILTPDDFTTAPCNYYWPSQTGRLLARLIGVCEQLALFELVQ